MKKISLKDLEKGITIKTKKETQKDVDTGKQRRSVTISLYDIDFEKIKLIAEKFDNSLRRITVSKVIQKVIRDYKL